MVNSENNVRTAKQPVLHDSNAEVYRNIYLISHNAKTVFFCFNTILNSLDTLNVVIREYTIFTELYITMYLITYSMIVTVLLHSFLSTRLFPLNQ